MPARPYRRVAAPSLAIVEPAQRPQRIPAAERGVLVQTDAVVTAAREAACRLLDEARAEAVREAEAAAARAERLVDDARTEAADYAERFRTELVAGAGPLLRDLLTEALQALGVGPGSAALVEAGLRRLADRGLLPATGELRVRPEAIVAAGAFATAECPVVSDPGLPPGAVRARSASGDVRVDLLAVLMSPGRRDAGAVRDDPDRFLDLGAEPTAQET